MTNWPGRRPWPTSTVPAPELSRADAPATRRSSVGEQPSKSGTVPYSTIRPSGRPHMLAPFPPCCRGRFYWLPRPLANPTIDTTTGGHSVERRRRRSRARRTAPPQRRRSRHAGPHLRVGLRIRAHAVPTRRAQEPRGAMLPTSARPVPPLRCLERHGHRRPARTTRLGEPNHRSNGSPHTATRPYRQRRGGTPRALRSGDHPGPAQRSEHSRTSKTAQPARQDRAAARPAVLRRFARNPRTAVALIAGATALILGTFGLRSWRAGDRKAT